LGSVALEEGLPGRRWQRLLFVRLDNRFGQGIPFLAIWAAPHPFGLDAAAGLADIARFELRHIIRALLYIYEE
jgi:hypothetical protein